MHRFTQHLPVEVISDPINDMDADPYEGGVETHRNSRGHQVILQFLFSLHNILMHIYSHDFFYHMCHVDQTESQVLTLERTRLSS